MTLSQQEEQKFAAWKRFEEARNELNAQESKLHGYEQLYNRLASMLGDGQLDLIEQVSARTPSRDEFAKAVEETRVARIGIERARSEARKFGWPTD